jgi:hypothetical protein
LNAITESVEKRRSTAKTVNCAQYVYAFQESKCEIRWNGGISTDIDTCSDREGGNAFD